MICMLTYTVGAQPLALEHCQNVRHRLQNDCSEGRRAKYLSAQEQADAAAVQH